MRPDKAIDFGIAGLIIAGLNFMTTKRIHRRLRDNFPAQPDAPSEIDPVIIMAQIVKFDLWWPGNAGIENPDMTPRF